MKSIAVVAPFSIFAFVVTVPLVAGVIRQIEPGRDRTIELQNLANQHIEVPTSGPFVLAHCADPCRLGSWVKLYAGRIPKDGFLAIYARSGDETVWYYPSASQFSPEVRASSDTQVLSDGLKLSHAHIGHKNWTLEIVLSDARYTRPQLEALTAEHVIAKSSLTLDLGEGI